MIQDQIKKLPEKNGCYIFQDAIGKIIYIGKAKNIRKRVFSYFHKDHEDGKTRLLVKDIHSIDYIVTRDEIEALIVEAQLIKQHQPKFNIDLKSGERYAYIRITHEKFPRLESARFVKKHDKVFGPYVNAEARKQTIRLANQIFFLRVCKNTRGRRCLLSHIGLCACPFATGMSVEEYSERLKNAVLFLRGNMDELKKKLQKEMKEYSHMQEFELAKKRRDQIAVLHHIKKNRPASLRRIYDQDVINFVETKKNIYIQQFHLNKGVISGKQAIVVRRFSNEQPIEIFSDFIKQYYYVHDIAREILVPEKLLDHDNIEKYFSRFAKKKIKITVPKRGDKKKILDLLVENIRLRMSQKNRALFEIQNVLGLETFPRNIECFDISNLGKNYKVGSMVHFTDGKPEKNQYRRFKIKTVLGQSDFDSMKEVVFRRYYRLVKEKASFPELVVIDGGKAQLSAALLAFRELGIQLPVIALAKRLEEIYTTDHIRPIRLSKRSASLKLLQSIRDEAHRFAIKYHRLLRGKNFIK